MRCTPTDAGSVEPPTTLGPAPDDPSKMVSLPDGALDAGCYIEGQQTPSQTALHHSWCVEWAEAGRGFWYVHPRGPDPWGLVARLPEKPELRYVRVPLAKAITRSVRRHSAELAWMTEEMRAETRAGYEN